MACPLCVYICQRNMYECLLMALRSLSLITHRPGSVTSVAGFSTKPVEGSSVVVPPINERDARRINEEDK
jgi:hypothetical protein